MWASAPPSRFTPATDRARGEAESVRMFEVPWGSPASSGLLKVRRCYCWSYASVSNGRAATQIYPSALFLISLWSAEIVSRVACAPSERIMDRVLGMAPVYFVSSPSPRRVLSPSPQIRLALSAWSPHIKELSLHSSLRERERERKIENALCRYVDC